MTKSIEQVARDVLNQILATSISERHEYGGMIYQQAGRFHATPPRTQGNPTTVDVGQRNPNKGCPPDTTPVAYYHTHPTYSVGGIKASYDKFSPEDMSVAEDFKLDAYVGTLDGSFLKYDWKLKLPLRMRGRLKNTAA